MIAATLKARNQPLFDMILGRSVIAIGIVMDRKRKPEPLAVLAAEVPPDRKRSYLLRSLTFLRDHQCPSLFEAHRPWSQDS
jgi:hypothetical protein